MTLSRQELGKRGEQLAQQYLKRCHYTIVTTNWHCEHGEIDIIARDGGTVVFVEVRTRHAINTETAFASIGPQKRKRLVATAQTYLDEHELQEDAWRIDAIAIAIPRYGAPIIEHVEDALDW